VSKHTPGPWKVNARYPFWVDDSAGHRLVDLESVRGSAESKANARLIAAAPAMYDAIRRYLELSPDCEYGGEPDVCPGVGGPCHWCELRAALRAAEGG
jgi:hypothetical protein